MAYSNGRLPQSALAAITTAVNGERAYLRKDAAAAFLAMNAESGRRFGVTLRVDSARTAYRSYADQEYFWQLYRSGRGNLAAEPGTSNHGLGLAVDLATEQMRFIVDQIGAKYGFSKAWSDAPSEWWHIKWREGTYPAVKPPGVLQRLAVAPIRRGMHSRDVRTLQVYLKRLGYLPASFVVASKTGTYGPVVQRAVKAFQKHVGLPADGVIGPKTFAALRRRAGRGAAGR